ASLEQHGHKAEIIDFGAEDVSKEYLKSCLKTADAVGMGVYTNNYEIAAETAKMIKELNSDIPLIIGGPHCTFLKERSLSHIPDADIVVELEGEFVILDLVQFFQGRKKLSDVHGIYYRENKKIKSGKPLQVIDNIDAIPFPARHLTEKYNYGNFLWMLQPSKKFTSMVTSRGCPFHCRFCSRYCNIKGWSYRRRSPENVIKEMQEINDKYRSVMIVDDTFLADPKWIHKTMDSIIETKLDLEILILGARVDTAEPELYKKMKKAGVKYVNFGIESGNQDILNFYNKKITLQQIQKAVNLAREMNFITQGTLIFGAPIETKEHIQNTIRFTSSLPLDIVIFQPLAYELGSDLWEDAVKNKILTKDDFMVEADSRRGLGHFTSEELDKYIKEAYRHFYFNPNYLVRLLRGAFLRKDVDHLKNAFKLAFSPLWGRVL
ncbi:MAG: radical SAM protein, partial [Thermoplasmatales archaeon]